MMKIKSYILIVLALVLSGLLTAAIAGAEPASNLEYQVKAAFIFNFIKFVDWPAGKASDGNEPMVIGILGKSPFGSAFDPIKDKGIKNRKIVIKQFESFRELQKSTGKNISELQQQIDDMKKCHLVFICDSEKDVLAEIVESMKGSPVLTIGEMPEMLDRGGMIRLLMENEKVRFEVNLGAAERASLDIRSQLLRLAKKVVKESDLTGNGGKSSKDDTKTRREVEG